MIWGFNMTHQRKGNVSLRRLLLSAAAVFAAGSVATSAGATPASGFVGTQIMKGQFGNLKIKLTPAISISSSIRAVIPTSM